MVDYQAAQALFVDEQRTFIDALAGLAGDQLSIVIHKTGGTPNLAALASFFQTNAEGASTTFGIDLDGTVGQFVLLKDGAGGNCCLEVGHDTYWDSFLATYGNLNKCTISIEHIDPSPDNSTTPPQAQLHASFALVKWLVDTYHIPHDHIKTHASLDPINRARCPGNYPMDKLFAFLAVQEVNPHMQQQMKDVWDMFLKGVGQPLVSHETGIAASWQQNYPQLNAGSPLGPEQKTVDWNGTDIQMQLFTGGISAEYNTQDHVVRWYDAYHKQVA